MVTAECHAHIFMDGVDYKKAAAAHENGPREDLIREHLAAYQKAGISEQMFADTMKCFPRFVREHKECFGDYGFDRAF